MDVMQYFVIHCLHIYCLLRNNVEELYPRSLFWFVSCDIKMETCCKDQHEYQILDQKFVLVMLVKENVKPVCLLVCEFYSDIV